MVFFLAMGEPRDSEHPPLAALREAAAAAAQCGLASEAGKTTEGASQLAYANPDKDEASSAIDLAGKGDDDAEVGESAAAAKGTAKYAGGMFSDGLMHDKVVELLDAGTRHVAVFEAASQYEQDVVAAVTNLWSLHENDLPLIVSESPRAGHQRLLTPTEKNFRRKFGKSWKMESSKHPKDYGVCSVLCLSYASLTSPRDKPTTEYSAWKMNVDSGDLRR